MKASVSAANDSGSPARASRGPRDAHGRPRCGAYGPAQERPAGEAVVCMEKAHCVKEAGWFARLGHLFEGEGQAEQLGFAPGAAEKGNARRADPSTRPIGTVMCG